MLPITNRPSSHQYMRGTHYSPVGDGIDAGIPVVVVIGLQLLHPNHPCHHTTMTLQTWMVDRRYILVASRRCLSSHLRTMANTVPKVQQRMLGTMTHHLQPLLERNLQPGYFQSTSSFMSPYPFPYPNIAVSIPVPSSGSLQTPE